MTRSLVGPGSSASAPFTSTLAGCSRKCASFAFLLLTQVGGQLVEIDVGLLDKRGKALSDSVALSPLAVASSTSRVELGPQVLHRGSSCHSCILKFELLVRVFLRLHGGLDHIAKVREASDVVVVHGLELVSRLVGASSHLTLEVEV